MLVDADLVRTKLAKVCEDMTCACCWTEDAQVAAETIADAIRQTDLTDCGVRGDTKLVDDLRRQLDPDFTKAMPHAEKLMAQSADAIESLSAQVAELQKVLAQKDGIQSGLLLARDILKSNGFKSANVIEMQLALLDAAKEGK